MRKELTPFLFGCFFILSFFYNNIGKLINYSENFKELGLMLAVTVIVLGLLRAVFRLFRRNQDYAIFCLSVLVIAFFSFGLVKEVLAPLQPRNRFLYPLYAIVIPTVFYFAYRAQQKLKPIVHFLSLLSLAAVGIILMSIAVYTVRWIQSTPPKKVYAEVKKTIGAHSLPDIYFIVADMYPSNRVLQEYFHYDNSQFTSKLSQQGFYVAKNSLSNYPLTIFSVPSTLGMEYVNYLFEKNNRYEIDYASLHRKATESKVVDFLKQRGYKYVFLGSRTLPLPSNSDVNIPCRGRSYMSNLFLITTLAQSFHHKFFKIKRYYRYNILCAFDGFPKVKKIKGPKFVFAHVMAPHPPFVFGKNGEEVEFVEHRNPLDTNKNRNQSEKLRQLFRDQLTFTSRQLNKAISHLLEGETTKPIIILQGDHGTNYGKPGRAYDSLTPQERAYENHGILNAYHVPEVIREKLYSSITPVNSFRLILGSLFEEPLDRLPDQIFDTDLTHNGYHATLREITPLLLPNTNQPTLSMRSALTSP